MKVRELERNLIECRGGGGGGSKKGKEIHRVIYISRFAAQGERKNMQDYIGNDPFSMRYEETYNEVIMDPEFDPNNDSVSKTLSQKLSRSSVGGQSEDNFSLQEDIKGECTTKNTRVYSLFDGHGGKACARKCAELFNTFLLRELDRGEETHEEILRDAPKKFHDDNCAFHRSGCTASVVLICPEKVWVANVGDSRVVVLQKTGGNKWRVIYSSPDHNTENPQELERLRKENLLVTKENPFDVPRFPTGLAVTRVIGDSESDGMVSRVPHVVSINMDNKDDYLVVMATDGFWESIANEDLPNLIEEMEGIEFDNVAYTMTKTALDKGSQDNVTVQLLLSRTK